MSSLMNEPIRFQKPVSIGTKKFFIKLDSSVKFITVNSKVTVTSDNIVEFDAKEIKAWAIGIQDLVEEALKNNYTRWFSSSVKLDTLIRMIKTNIYKGDSADCFGLPMSAFDEEPKDGQFYKFNIKFTGIQVEPTKIIAFVAAEDIEEMVVAATADDIVSDDNDFKIESELTEDIAQMMMKKDELRDKIRSAKMATLMAKIAEDKLKEEYVALYDSDGWTTEGDESDEEDED